MLRLQDYVPQCPSSLPVLIMKQRLLMTHVSF